MSNTKTPTSVDSKIVQLSKLRCPLHLKGHFKYLTGREVEIMNREVYIPESTIAAPNLESFEDTCEGLLKNKINDLDMKEFEEKVKQEIILDKMRKSSHCQYYKLVRSKN